MKYLLSLVFIFIFSLSYSQRSGSDTTIISNSSIIPLNRDIQNSIDRYNVISDNKTDYFSENKSYFTDYNRYFIEPILFGRKHKPDKSIGAFLYNKLFIESLIKIKSQEVKLTIDPIFNFGYGKFNTSERSLYDYNTTYINTRGFIIRGAIGKKQNLTFFSTLYENQGRYIDYIDGFVKSHKVLPGEGVVKNFKTNAYDYSSATGIISWAPSSHFNFQFGHGKNFIGDGYRSLLLSDNSFNYPFLKTKFDFGRFEYTNIYASFMIPIHHKENIYTKKYATMHLLTCNISKGFNFSLFESTMWKATDGNLNLPFKAKYLNPLIGIQTLATGLNDIDNTLIGINTKYTFGSHHSFYGQFVADDINFSGKVNYKNKIGMQIGYKYFDVFNIHNLYFQTEYNAVKPYTYAHNDSVQSYTHYNQALAHPLGANFRESVTIINYRWKQFLFEFKFNYAVFGSDTNNYNYGQNILISQNPDKYVIDLTKSKIGQGLKNTLISESLRIYYLLNPVTNLNIYFELQNRQLKSDIINYNSTYINFGIKTNLENFYYDF
jgi:hypothetical protein